MPVSNQLPLLINSGTGGVPDIPTLRLAEEDPRILKRFGPRNLIVDQVPDFINRDHETFRSFVEAYYEWMEWNQNAYGMIDGYSEYMDIDRSFGEFVSDFRSMYLINFPMQLAYDTEGNIVSEATFLKNARRFYGAKGTEKAFRFLFRLLYNVSSNVYYPGKDILKASDGAWVELISLKTTSSGGTGNLSLGGNRIYQTNSTNGQVNAYAIITDVVQYSKDYYTDVTEFFIKNKFGTFTPNLPVFIDLPNGTKVTETLYPVISECKVLAGGLGYSLSDVIDVIAPANGSGVNLSIDTIKDTGEITGIRINDSGIGYDRVPTARVRTNSGNGKARLELVIGAISNYPGYYRNNNGKLSSNKRLYDAYYYQEFSYALQSEISFSQYKELYKKLIHPAGLKMFGDILIARDIVDSLPFHTEMQRYEIPYIGHYTPYRIGTTADLYTKYINGFNPRGDTFSSIQNYGDTGGKLFVAPVGFTFNSGLTWNNISATGGDSNIITANVFEFMSINDGGTRGVLLLKQIDFDLLDIGTDGSVFVEGNPIRMFTGTGAGYTATIQIVRPGTGIVYENTGATHDTQGLPLGVSGSYEGYIEAKGFSYAYWRIYHHPNTRTVFGLTAALDTTGTGSGASFASVVLNPFFRMPIGYHFHSNPDGGPYEGTTGDDNQYGLIESNDLTSPNF